MADISIKIAHNFTQPVAKQRAENALKDRQYSEYRTDMWCKPIGNMLLCFDLEKMELYWLNGNKVGGHTKFRSNISRDKMVQAIKEYEHQLLLI